MTRPPLSARRAVGAALVLAALLTPSGAAQMDPNDPLMRVPLEHWGCTNCHATDEAQAALVAQRPGPDLSEAGARLSPAWMRRWIARPASVRNAPAMPRLFGEGAEEQRDLDALVSYLASLGRPAGGAVATEAQVIDGGRTLYHTLGCVACHGALESPAAVHGDDFLPHEVPADFVLHPFGDLAGKWYPAALAAYLREPQKVHRDGRMPQMDLSAAEADLVATYLLTRLGAADVAGASDAALVARGREVFGERGCQACHVIGGESFAPVQAAPLTTIAARAHRDPRGCLGTIEWDGPRYDFPSPQIRGMFQGVLFFALNAEVEDPELDALERRVYHLNCKACHEIDHEGGVSEGLRTYFVSLDDHADLGDEGRLPPHLNDVGEKLTTPWFEEVLQRSGRARPYIAARMPQYGAAVAGFPELFARKHGVEPNSDALWPVVDDDAALLGRELMGPQAMACMNCHTYKDYPPLGTPGPDITHFAERLRYAWWNAYIRDPAAKKPGTRMPSFMNGDQAAFQQYAGGDFQKQADALWSYFTLGEFMPAPEGVSKKQSLTLQVGDTPRILRTFVEGAGTRAIAVGFPVGVHYAFDAAKCRLAEVWRGEFLDASGAWAGRGGNSTDPEGALLWKAPKGPLFLRGAAPATWPETSGTVDYRGYARGGDAGPTFHYLLDGVEVHETITPHAEPTPYLERALVLDGLEPGAPLCVRPGAVLRNLAVDGAAQRLVPAADGETWLELVPKSSTLTVTLEVAP
ncbi:MAG: c-type cytochrome [Planctomycetes bacterium]|nr:c-type cytochrome [Planctomycetota bacterium]